MSHLRTWLEANMLETQPMDIPLEAHFTVQGRSGRDLHREACKVLLDLHDDPSYVVSYHIDARPLAVVDSTGDVKLWEGDVYAVFVSKAGDPGPIGTDN